MWMLNGPERNIPPAEFQERLTYLGGVNRYDEPNFRIWWSGYAYGDGSFRAGGIWSVDEEYFKGYRDLLRSSERENCWCLGQWHDASEYSAPEAYYLQNFDEDSGLQILGEYPYSGRVELLYALRWYEMVDDKLTFHTMPLSTTTFDSIIPIIILAKEVSLEKRKAAVQAARELEENEKLGEIEKFLRDHSAPFGGNAVSFSRQGIRSTAVDKKMMELQRQWNQVANAAKSFRLGLQTR